MKLVNGKTYTLDGEYTMRLYSSSGSAKLQRIDGTLTPLDVPDASTTNADLLKNIKISGLYLAVMTGDGEGYLSKINV